MKKIAILVLSVLAVSFFLGFFAMAQESADFRAIKSALAEGASSGGEKEVKWFKILITDNRTGKDKVKVTLPISVVELFLKYAEDDHLKFHEHHTDIDLRQVLKELKSMAPMSIIEINEDGETIKIWFE